MLRPQHHVNALSHSFLSGGPSPHTALSFLPQAIFADDKVTNALGAAQQLNLCAGRPPQENGSIID